MAEAHLPHGYKQYVMIWVWLLVMTLLALGVGYTSIPHGLKALLLVCITLAKIGLIGAFFMHLKFERMNLVMLTFSPLVLSIILFFFTYGETRYDPTHKLIIRGANSAQAEAPKH
jgi:cytochrome c oxidase subunit 4